MEFEVVVSIYEKGKEDAEPVREEIIDADDLAEANELVDEMMELTEEEGAAIDVGGDEQT